MPLTPATLRKQLNDLLSNFRYRLAHTDALPQLAILGCISGLITGAIAVLFRLSFELPLGSLLDAGDTESFETLGSYWHFWLPLLGILLVGVILHFTPKHRRGTGVAHVVDRVQQHQGRLPSGNALVQFLCGSLLISSGAPVGREGPAVHLGAAAASGLGQRLRLPNNNLRLLAGCGAAAAIAASFNTPLAGVIFAMEVVLLEYTITGFIPVILASVCGTIVSRAVYGDDPAFVVPAMEMGSLWEVPYLIVSGLLIGLFASVMLKFHTLGRHIEHWPILVRALLAGLIAGTAGWLLPPLLGIGYDTIELALLGNLGLGLLITIGIAKLLLASSMVGLGLPGGMISPTLVSGACLGGALGIIGGYLHPEQASASGFYAMLGMGATMGAVLNAPLAALIALLELTYNPGVLMPAMLVIVVASITARMFSKLPGLFFIGRDPDRFSSPVFQMLSRAGVTSLMNRNLADCPNEISAEKARELLDGKPDWLVVAPKQDGEYKLLMSPADLAHYLHERREQDGLCEQDNLPFENQSHNGGLIDLHNIPGKHRQLRAIHARATLQEALLMMRQQQVMAVYVNRTHTLPLQSDVLGVITREAIDNYYH